MATQKSLFKQFIKNSAHYDVIWHHKWDDFMSDFKKILQSWGLFALNSPWDQTSLVLNSIEKVKPGFFTFLNIYISSIERDKILISQFLPPKFRYFADQNGPKGGPHENEFWHFSNTKLNITNRAQKVDEENGVICLVSFFPT